MVFMILKYAGFGWGRIRFHHSAWYEAMFWVFAEHRANNIEAVPHVRIFIHLLSMLGINVFSDLNS